MSHIRNRLFTLAVVAAIFLPILVTTGCATRSPELSESAVRDAIDLYSSEISRHRENSRPACADFSAIQRQWRYACSSENTLSENDLTVPLFTLSVMPEDEVDVTTSQPSEPTATADLAIPEGYWRKDLWHQMGHEAKAFGTENLWRGFKTSFWDLENALLLTAAMGASVTIRETGVDNTIRGRIHGHNQLGDGGEVIQVLGNPATHFAGAGILWLTSTLSEDMKQHEVAQSLTEALAVTGITTLGLKFTAGTREPDGDKYGWPSGHTASSVAVAAVLNEHYGPLVGIPCFALAGLVGYERLDSREHDLSDVVFGAMLGYIVGTSVARDEKAQFPELWGMTVVPFTDIETGASGIALMKSW